MAHFAEMPRRCFDGIVPATVSTCAADGTPNVAILSHVYLVDGEHVALSRQFFNKTTRNVLENPAVIIDLWDPVDFDAWRLHARYVRSETSGPTFETMSIRIDAIASHTGMTGIFKLQAADIFRVIAVDHVTDHLEPAPDGPPPEDDLPALDHRAPDAREELWALQRVTQRLNRARSLAQLYGDLLACLAEDFGFHHSRIFVLDPDGDTLRTAASNGYPDPGLGTLVPVGTGVIGTVAKERHSLRLSRLDHELKYGRVVRAGMAATQPCPQFSSLVPLPGLPDARSMVVLPLLVGERLVGVLSIESRSPHFFESWHEAFLGVVADQVASGIERLRDEPRPQVQGDRPVRHFVYYQNDDCIFVDGEYLVRNVPARILWRLLASFQADGRTEFTNRELRLDPSLGLPPVKDNLESRLVLLRKRLDERLDDVRLVPLGRGRFGMELECEVALEERPDASS